MEKIHHDINNQIYKAVENLGGGMELLATIGSYGDTLDDDEVLECLEMYNEKGTYIHKTLFSVHDTPEDRRSRFTIVKQPRKAIMWQCKYCGDNYTPGCHKCVREDGLLVSDELAGRE